MTGTIFLICGLISTFATLFLPEKKLKFAVPVSAGFISASAIYLWYLIFRRGICGKLFFDDASDGFQNFCALGGTTRLIFILAVDSFVGGNFFDKKQNAARLIENLFFPANSVDDIGFGEVAVCGKFG